MFYALLLAIALTAEAAMSPVQAQNVDHAGPLCAPAGADDVLVLLAGKSR